MGSVRLDRRGITGLETAIVLIAFVVVASVFAFAVLSTGLLSSEKSKETVLGAHEETGATLAVRGSVIAYVTSSNTYLNHVTFQVSNASQTGEAVELSSNGAIVSYVDADQAVTDLTYQNNAPTTSTEGWNATWLEGSSPLLSPTERVEITVNISQRSPTLGTNKEFTIEVKPSRGAILILERTTPGELTAVVDLK